MTEELPGLFTTAQPLCEDCEVLLKILKGKGWMTAREILQVIGLPETEKYRRTVRDLASGSSGRIAGGQNGYELVAEMTQPEFDHYYNWMDSQARVMRERIRLSKEVFTDRHSK